MRSATLTTLAVFSAVSLASAHAQEPADSSAAFVKPLVITSLGYHFSVVGRFVGRITVLEDSIVAELDTLFATRVHHGGPVQVTRLDSIRIGVGKGTERSWSPTDNSPSLQVERVMTVGSSIQLPAARFVIPHRRNADDGNAWLVVTFHLTVGRLGEPDFHSDATTYAHSAKGILDGPPAISRTPPRKPSQSAPEAQTGFLARRIVFNGREYRYQVFVPVFYTKAQSWPVILSLHGAGERGTDGVVQTQAGVGKTIREDSSAFPAIVVMPQAPPDSSWSGTTAQLALETLLQTMREFRTDPARIYLTGFSMGGNGVWYIAYRNPMMFAALAPICGWVAAHFWQVDPVIPPGSGEPHQNLARRLKSVPTWIVHGMLDDAVPVDRSRLAAGALQAIGAPVKYTELPGVGHNSWDPAYASPPFWNWLLAQRNSRSK